MYVPLRIYLYETWLIIEKKTQQQKTHNQRITILIEKQNR